MALSPLEILDIIELSLFTPLLYLSWILKKRHETAKVAAFEFVLVVVVFRVIGSAVGIASAHVSSSGTVTAADVITNLALPFLLAAAIEFLTRVNGRLWSKGILESTIQLLFLPLLAGFIMNIVGRVRIHDSNASPTIPSHSLLKAAGFLFLATLIGIFATTLNNVLRIGHIEHDDRKIIFAVAAAVPFLLVRVVYELLCANSENSRWFSTYSTFVGGVVVQALAGTLPELVTVIIFLVAGLKIPATTAPTEPRDAEVVSELEDATPPSQPLPQAPPPAYSSTGKN